MCCRCAGVLHRVKLVAHAPAHMCRTSSPNPCPLFSREDSSKCALFTRARACVCVLWAHQVTHMPCSTQTEAHYQNSVDLLAVATH
mgnify:CR=1 FL=1